jgi:hypothetical protein
MSTKQSTPKICSVEGCGKPHLARGLCKAHYNKAWNAANREKVHQQMRRWRTKHREKELERCRQWRKSRPGWAAEYERRRRRADPEKAKEQSRQRRKVDAEKIREQRRVRHALNGDKQRERRRKWAVSNPDKILAKNNRRRARKKNTNGTFSAANWRDLLARSPCCHWCKRPWTKKRKATHDHIIALSKGGQNSVANSVCACFECNTRKGNRRFNPINGQGILI